MNKLITVIFSVLILVNSIVCLGSGEEKEEEESKLYSEDSEEMASVSRQILEHYTLIGVAWHATRDAVRDVAAVAARGNAALNAAILSAERTIGYTESFVASAVWFSIDSAIGTTGKRIVFDEVWAVAYDGTRAVAHAAAAAVAKSGGTEINVGSAAARAALIYLHSNTGVIETILSERVTVKRALCTRVQMLQACLELFSIVDLNSFHQSLLQTRHLLMGWEIFRQLRVDLFNDDAMRKALLRFTNQYGQNAYQVHRFHQDRLERARTVRLVQIITQLRSVLPDVQVVLLPLIAEYATAGVVMNHSEIILDSLNDPTISDPHFPAAAAAAAKTACDGVSAVQLAAERARAAYPVHVQRVNATVAPAAQIAIPTAFASRSSACIVQ